MTTPLTAAEEREVFIELAIAVVDEIKARDERRPAEIIALLIRIDRLLNLLGRDRIEAWRKELALKREEET